MPAPRAFPTIPASARSRIQWNHPAQSHRRHRYLCPSLPGRFVPATRRRTRRSAAARPIRPPAPEWAPVPDGSAQACAPMRIAGHYPQSLCHRRPTPVSVCPLHRFRRSLSDSPFTNISRVIHDAASHQVISRFISISNKRRHGKLTRAT